MKKSCFSTGEAAEALGLTRDSLLSAIRAGAPDASQSAGGRRLFTENDLFEIFDWSLPRPRQFGWPSVNGKELGHDY